MEEGRSWLGAEVLETLLRRFQLLPTVEFGYDHGKLGRGQCPWQGGSQEIKNSGISKDWLSTN